MDEGPSVGTLIQKCREKIKLRQAELAEEIHRHGSTISKYETGAEQPPTSVVGQIASVFSRRGVPEEMVDQLLRRAGGVSHARPGAPIDTTTRLLSQKLERMPAKQREFALDALRDVADVVDMLSTAEQKNAAHRWREADRELDRAQERWGGLAQRIELGLHRTRRDVKYSLGDYEATLMYGGLIRHTLDGPEGSGSWQGAVDNCLRLGAVHRRMADWSTAMELFNSAEKECRDHGDPPWEAECMRKRSGVLILQGQVEEALGVLHMCEDVLPRTPGDHDLIKSKVLRHRAWALSLKGDWDESIRLYDDASELIERCYPTGRDDGTREVERARSARYLADVYSMRAEWYLDAELCYARAQDTLENLESRCANQIKLLKGANLRGRAFVLRNVPGKERDVDRFLEQSEDLFRELREVHNLSIVYLDRGRLQLERGQLDRAEGYLRLAMERLSERKSLYHLGETYAVLCRLHLTRAAQNTEIGGTELGNAVKLCELLKGGVIPGIGSMFHIHYSEIQRLAAHALLEQGANQAGIRLLCSAAESGLAHNGYVFRERVMDLFAEADALICKHDVDTADALYKSFEMRLSSYPGRSESPDTIIDCLQQVGAKRREIAWKAADRDRT